MCVYIYIYIYTYIYIYIYIYICARRGVPAQSRRRVRGHGAQARVARRADGASAWDDIMIISIISMIRIVDYYIVIWLV